MEEIMLTVCRHPNSNDHPPAGAPSGQLLASNKERTVEPIDSAGRMPTRATRRCS